MYCCNYEYMFELFFYLQLLLVLVLALLGIQQVSCTKKKGGCGGCFGFGNKPSSSSDPVVTYHQPVDSGDSDM